MYGAAPRSASSVRPVCSPGAAVAAMPRKNVASSAIAMPTEHNSRYFHVASSAERRL
jgi:hypothetical protein